MNPLLKFIAAHMNMSWYEDKSIEKYPDNATAPNMLVKHHFKVLFTHGSRHRINLDYVMNVIERFYMNDGVDVHMSEVTGAPNSCYVEIVSQGISVPTFLVAFKGNALMVVTQK